MKLLTKAQEKKLIKNFHDNVKSADEKAELIDFKPVVKFFGGGSFTWLFTEYDEENRMFYGLCDLGQGFPELGYVSRDELESLRFPPFGLPVERDRYTTFDKTISEYFKEAKEAGSITV